MSSTFRRGVVRGGERVSIFGLVVASIVFILLTNLASHLDAVRAVAFHPSELCLATGGDDNTVKIWRVDGAGLASSA